VSSSGRDQRRASFSRWERVKNSAARLAPDVARGDVERLLEEAPGLEAFNPRFLQINVMDHRGVCWPPAPDGRSSRPIGSASPFNLDGKRVASDAVRLAGLQAITSCT